MPANPYEIVASAIEPTAKPSIWDRRAVRITAITVGGAIALAASFGAGVAAGQQMGGSSSNDSNHFGPGGNPVGGGPNGFQPGGPNPNDPDHGAGTDRPGGSGGKWAPTASATTGTTTSKS